MSIKGRSLWTLKDAIRVVEAGGEFRVREITPPGVNPTVNVREDEVVVETEGQSTFTLTVDPLPGAIHSIVIDRKTYFEPQFQLSGRTLTIPASTLALGTTIRFESIGGGLASGHFRLEAIPVLVEETTVLVLDGMPQGDVAEVYVGGQCYPQSEGHFRVEQNRVIWLNSQIKLKYGFVIYVLYARTAEAGAILEQQSVVVNATTPRTLALAGEPAVPPRLYRRGLRYFATDDFTVAGEEVTALSSVPYVVGDKLTYCLTLSPVIIPEQPPTEEPPPPSAPTSYFGVLTATATDDQTAFPGLATGVQSDKSLLALNGLTYVQGKGYAVADGAVTWGGAPALKADDKLQLTGFKDARVAAAFTFAEVVPGATIDLGAATAAPGKLFAILASAGGYGGALYGPSAFTHQSGNRVFAWVGTPALKGTDKLIVCFLTDATIAAAVSVVEHTVGATLDWTLGKQPAQIALAALNGVQIPEGDLTVANKVVSYAGAPALKEGDKLLLVFY